MAADQGVESIMAIMLSAVSRRLFLRGIAGSTTLPLFDRIIAARTAAQGGASSRGTVASGGATLPLRSPGLDHFGMTVPDPKAAADFYGRIFNPQLFKERDGPPRYYVTAGNAYIGFGGS